MIETKSWRFRAEVARRKVHTVTKTKDEYACTCPVFTYSKPHECRHVRLVRSGLAGLAINEEPELAWGVVDHVQIYRDRVLVPFFRDDDRTGVYRIIWELRQLGISKRECASFLGVRCVSDVAIENFLKEQGIIPDEERTQDCSDGDSQPFVEVEEVVSP